MKSSAAGDIQHRKEIATNIQKKIRMLPWVPLGLLLCSLIIAPAYAVDAPTKGDLLKYDPNTQPFWIPTRELGSITVENLAVTGTCDTRCGLRLCEGVILGDPPGALVFKDGCLTPVDELAVREDGTVVIKKLVVEEECVNCGGGGGGGGIVYKSSSTPSGAIAPGETVVISETTNPCEGEKNVHGCFCHSSNANTLVRSYVLRNELIDRDTACKCQWSVENLATVTETTTLTVRAACEAQ